MTDSRSKILGVGFDNLTMGEALDAAMGLMQSKKGGYLATPNPEIVMLCQENTELSKAVSDADMVLPDGIGIIYGAKILGTPLKQKIPGIDFIQELFSEMSKKHMSVFLLGAKPGVAELAEEKLKTRYAGLQFLGTNDGYFSDDRPIIEKINSAAPDLLLVCLGTPKQELWMSKSSDKLDVGLMAGLGGSLDVFAGIVERAPEKWRSMGFEWLYRLINDPSRASRMSSIPKFCVAIIKEKLNTKKR